MSESGDGKGGGKAPAWAARFGEEVARKASREERRALREEARARQEAQAFAARRGANAALAAEVYAATRPFASWARQVGLERVAEGGWLYLRAFVAPEPASAVRVGLSHAPDDLFRTSFTWDEIDPDAELADLDEDVLHQLLAYFRSERPWEDARASARGRDWSKDPFEGAVKELLARVDEQLAALPSVPTPTDPALPLARQVWLASRPFRHWTAMYDLDRVGVLVIKSRHLKFGRVHLHWYLRGQEWNGVFSERELGGRARPAELEYYRTGRCWHDLKEKLLQLARDGRDKPSMTYLGWPR
jgi:hypothetical protein